ncbi:hypothetical protein [Herpetosiphon gulosus]|uniref:Uncharacterized protein n=1 Tax=Herpetosiphon gulosus TaxID=1973496 RepID=A0ABP9X7S6_9CHLR
MQAVIQGQQDYVGTFNGMVVIRDLEFPDPYTSGPTAGGAGAAFMYDIHDIGNRERCDTIQNYRLVWNAVKNNLPGSTREVYTWLLGENPALETDIDNIANNHGLNPSLCYNILSTNTDVYLPAVIR